MTRTITRGKGFMVLLALGLGLLFLVACGSGGATSTPGPSNGSTGQQVDTAALLAALLAAPAGSEESAALGRSLLAASGGVGLSGNANTGIWVTGRGEVTATPDLAVLNLGVEALAGTVQEARENAAAAMGRIVGVLQARGIADEDIQTRFFNISPRYSSREVTVCSDGDGVSPVPEGPTVERSLESLPPEPIVELRLVEGANGNCFLERQQVITGYQVTNQLTVKVRDLDAVGGTIDEVTEAGGDLIRLQGINFTIEDNEALQVQARAAAVADLMDKASQFATLTQTQLGKLLFITETGGFTPVPVFAERAFAVSASPTPIMAGELSVEVTVQAVFAIL